MRLWKTHGPTPGSDLRRRPRHRPGGGPPVRPGRLPGGGGVPAGGSPGGLPGDPGGGGRAGPGAGGGPGPGGALAAACAAVEGWGGSPEVLVYNASAGAPGPAADLDPARLQADFRVNVGAPLAAVPVGPARHAPGRAGHPPVHRRRAGPGAQAGAGLRLPGQGGPAQPGPVPGGELAPEGIHAATVTSARLRPGGHLPGSRTWLPKYSGNCTCKKRGIGSPERLLPLPSAQEDPGRIEIEPTEPPNV